MDNNKELKRDNPNYDKIYKMCTVINNFNAIFTSTVESTILHAFDKHVIKLKVKIQ